MKRKSVKPLSHTMHIYTSSGTANLRIVDSELGALAPSIAKVGSARAGAVAQDGPKYL